jgi:hypothetical protein
MCIASFNSLNNLGKIRVKTMQKREYIRGLVPLRESACPEYKSSKKQGIKVKKLQKTSTI